MPRHLTQDRRGVACGHHLFSNYSASQAPQRPALVDWSIDDYDLCLLLPSGPSHAYGHHGPTHLPTCPNLQPHHLRGSFSLIPGNPPFPLSTLVSHLLRITVLEIVFFHFVELFVRILYVRLPTGLAHILHWLSQQSNSPHAPAHTFAPRILAPERALRQSRIRHT